MSGVTKDDAGGQAGVTMTVVGSAFTTGVTMPMRGHKYVAAIVKGSGTTAIAYQIIYDVGGNYTLMGVTGGSLTASEQTFASMGPIVAANAYIQIKCATAAVTGSAYVDWMHSS